MLKKSENKNEVLKSKYVHEDGTEVTINIKDLMDTIDDENKENKENKKTCLITGEKIKEPFVIMECGHTFNYVPLYKDLINQKNKFQILDTDKLGLQVVRCPYCRSKQNTLLPYYELPEVMKIHGINWLDEECMKNVYYKGLCEFVSPYLDNHYFHCSNNYVIKMSDGKSYCFYHQKIKTKQLLKEKAKKEKEKQKEEVKKAWMEKKAKEKAEKAEKAKENVVLCQSILKSGVRKGEPCGQKTPKYEVCCLRHYKMKNEKNSEKQ